MASVNFGFAKCFFFLIIDDVFVRVNTFLQHTGLPLSKMRPDLELETIKCFFYTICGILTHPHLDPCIFVLLYVLEINGYIAAFSMKIVWHQILESS